MRIFQILEFNQFDTGSVHQMFQAAAGLRERGHDVTIVSRPGSVLEARAAEHDVRFEGLPMRNAFDVVSARRLRPVLLIQRSVSCEASPTTSAACWGVMCPPGAGGVGTPSEASCSINRCAVAPVPLSNRIDSGLSAADLPIPRNWPSSRHVSTPSPGGGGAGARPSAGASAGTSTAAAITRPRGCSLGRAPRADEPLLASGPDTFGTDLKGRQDWAMDRAGTEASKAESGSGLPPVGLDAEEAGADEGASHDAHEVRHHRQQRNQQRARHESWHYQVV